MSTDARSGLGSGEAHFTIWVMKATGLIMENEKTLKPLAICRDDSPQQFSWSITGLHVDFRIEYRTDDEEIFYHLFSVYDSPRSII